MITNGQFVGAKFNAITYLKLFFGLILKILFNVIVIPKCFWSLQVVCCCCPRCPVQSKALLSSFVIIMFQVVGLPNLRILRERECLGVRLDRDLCTLAQCSCILYLKIKRRIQTAIICISTIAALENPEEANYNQSLGYTKFIVRPRHFQNEYKEGVECNCKLKISVIDALSSYTLVWSNYVL